MTVQQVVEWIDAANDAVISKSKDNAALLNGQALQIISGVGSMLDKKVKYLTLEKLYPELFWKKADTKNLAPKQVRQREVAAWRTFLGV